MQLNYSSNFGQAVKALQKMRSHYQKFGKRWVSECTAHLREQLIANLESQGRSGQSPPLSEMTKQIYQQHGEPDGSGIAEHIGVTITKNGNSWVGTVGIASGKPTMIAKIQDQGATIPVTDAMRGFLSASYGIHLRQETTHIHIPGRRFWRLSSENTKKFALQKLKNHDPKK